MNTLFAFLLFLIQIPAHDTSPEEQVRFWVSEISNGESSPESLWAVVQIYRENREYRELLLREARDKQVEWSHLLDTGDATLTSLEQLAIHLNDEHLHLYLQLNGFPDEEKKNRFEIFYEHLDDPQLKELNRSIAYENRPNESFLEQGGWDFALFLLLLRSHHIERPDSFYQTVLSRLDPSDDKIEQLSATERDYYSASLLLSYYNLNRYHAIASDYDRLIDMKGIPGTSVKRNLYRLLDYALYSAGQIDQSLNVQRLHTLPLSEQLGDRYTLNEILANHGGYLYTIGRFGEARDVFETALEDTSNMSDAIRTRLLNNLSLTYYKLGEQSSYIETQMDAHSLAVEQENLNYQLSIYRNLHIYYRQNQNWDLAHRYIDHARRIAEAAGDHQELGSIIISKAVYHDQYLGDLDQAFKLLAEADHLLEESTNYRLRVRLLTEMADLYSKRGDFRQSRDIYREVLNIGSENSNDFMYLGALIDLAETELQMGNLDRSYDHIREFNAHDVTIIDFPALVDARRIEADIAFQENRYRDAETLIDLVYPLVLERARNTTDIEGGYWRVEQAYLKLFQLYAELLMDQNRGEELVGVLDQLKTINDAALFESPLVQAEHLSEEELAENRRILNRLDLLRKQYLVTDRAERLSLRNEIASLTARKNRLTRAQSPAEFEDVDRLWTLRSQLGRGDIILHSTRVLDRFYLVMIDRNQIRYKRFTVDSETEKMFQTAIQGLGSGDTDLNILYDIYQWLELDQLPRSARSLIVIPDSYLYHLPLGVLPVSPPEHRNSYGSARYLVEDLNIRYLNHLRDLNRRNARQTYTHDFTGFGISSFDHLEGDLLVPLPDAPREVEQIAALLSGRGPVQAITDASGTPHRFRESTSNSRVLHLASHSYISDNDPLFSRIYLAPSAESDIQSPNGQIFAYQLFDMDLNNELIMFNSCESGSGEVLQGAGVMGLSRALRYAGAQSLVLNSWIVNDQYASSFAVQFYDQLSKGKSKSHALGAAQIHFLEHSNANPHYWGAYIMNGDDRPLYPVESNRPLTALLSLLFVTGLVLTRFQQRRFAGKET